METRRRTDQTVERRLFIERSRHGDSFLCRRDVNYPFLTTHPPSAGDWRVCRDCRDWRLDREEIYVA